jgi:RNA polymerase sigma factor (sigma-70 family)
MDTDMNTTDRSENFMALLRPIEHDLESYCRRMVWRTSDALGAMEQAADYSNWLMSPASVAEWLDDDLVTALQSLTDVERAAMLLRAIGGFRYREIAISLDVPVGSVMGHLPRARRKLREAVMRSRRRTTS